MIIVPTSIAQMYALEVGDSVELLPAYDGIMLRKVPSEVLLRQATGDPSTSHKLEFGVDRLEAVPPSPVDLPAPAPATADPPATLDAVAIRASLPADSLPPDLDLIQVLDDVRRFASSARTHYPGDPHGQRLYLQACAKKAAERQSIELDDEAAGAIVDASEVIA